MNDLPRILITILAITFAQFAYAQDNKELSVHADFEGGSAVVSSIDQEANSVYFKPGGDSIQGWPNWWYFRVDNVKPGTNLTVVVDNPFMGFWAKPDRASYSLDGKNWHHTAPGIERGNSIVYNQFVNDDQIWFAWGPPFVITDANNLVNKMADQCPGADVFKLANTLNNHPVPALEIACGRKPKNERPVIWIQARQHAWEAGSSWVAQGFIEWLMGEDASALRLRKSTEIIFVPVMDVDNVLTGNGGKNQVPHDHNRDWSQEPIYPAVSAAQKKIEEYNRAGRFQLFVDLHNPGKAKSAYFYTPPFEKMDEETIDAYHLFAKITENHMQKAPIPFDSKPRESGVNYAKNWQTMSKNWVLLNSEPGVVAVTFEVAWNSPYSTCPGYLSVGKQLGISISDYIEKKFSLNRKFNTSEKL